MLAAQLPELCLNDESMEADSVSYVYIVFMYFVFIQLKVLG